MLVIHLLRSWQSHGNQEACLCALCFNSAGSTVIVVFSEMNSVCNIHSRVQPCSSDENVLLLNNFSHLYGLLLLACGKLEGHIDGLLHMLGKMYQWCVGNFSNSLWNIPTPVDYVLDGLVIQTHVKIDALYEQRGSRTASREEIRSHVAPAVSPRTIGNRLLAAGLR